MSLFEEGIRSNLEESMRLVSLLFHYMIIYFTNYVCIFHRIYYIYESCRHNIRISVIGDRTSLLPKSFAEVITEAEEKTKANSRLHLILAINYGGQDDILQASRKLCKKVKDGSIQEEEINAKIFEQQLWTNICTQFPFPDLVIRFGGEVRLSNFLSYQSAYAELYFTQTLFPDFRQEDFIMALKSFQKRNRRYGI